MKRAGRQEGLSLVGVSLPSEQQTYDRLPIHSNILPIFIFATMLQIWQECRTGKGLRGEKRIKKYPQVGCLRGLDAFV
jgi:hypothetical protein